MSIDLLICLVTELIMVVKDNGKAYAVYISDLFSRCKVQKVILHSLLATVHDMQQHSGSNGGTKADSSGSSFTEDILEFNEIFVNLDERTSNFSEAFQVQILRLLLALVMLEQVINQQQGMSGKPRPSSLGAGQNVGGNRPQVLRYLNDHVIPDQPMFLAAIVNALKQEKMRHLHPHWTSLVTNCLPFLGQSLTSTVLDVTAQLCKNLERLAPFYLSPSEANDDEVENGTEDVNGDPPIDTQDLGQIPADYIVTQMEALTVMFHFCLIDSASQVGATSMTSLGGVGVGAGSKMGSGGDPHASGEVILSNLLHVFLSNSDAQTLMASSMESGASMDALAMARRHLLATLPRLISCAAVMWSAIQDNSGHGSKDSAYLVGTPKAVKSRLLDLLSPIAHHHSVAFLSAIGITWQERRTPGSAGLVKNPLPSCNASQQVLVDLVNQLE